MDSNAPGASNGRKSRKRRRNKNGPDSDSDHETSSPQKTQFKTDPDLLDPSYRPSSPSIHYRDIKPPSDSENKIKPDPDASSYKISLPTMDDDDTTPFDANDEEVTIVNITSKSEKQYIVVDVPSSPPLHLSPTTTPQNAHKSEQDPNLESNLDEFIPSPPTAGRTTPEASAQIFDKYENDNSPESPQVSNVFQFSSKPLPHIKAARKIDLEVQCISNVSPKVQFEEDSSDDEITLPGMDGMCQPIIYHDVDTDDEGEDDKNVEPSPAVDIGQRYFKQKGIRGRFNFQNFVFPEMKNLAVYQHKAKILTAILTNHVVVIEGFTGCGKTTQVPQFILDYCVENEQACEIIVTQPRRLATISVAKRVCNERGWELGGIVGYQVGMDSNVGRDTMVTYMTTGVLLQKLIGARSLKRYTHIIIDEVHERDLETDFLLLVIKKILMEDKGGQQRHVKIILMSATLNAQKFSQYFSIRKSKDANVEQAPIIKIPLTQMKHEVNEAFLENFMSSGDMKELEFSLEKAVLHSEIYDVAVQAIISLDTIDRRDESGNSADPRNRGQHYAHIRPENRGSVLCFLPGYLEIDTLHKRLDSENSRNDASQVDRMWNIIPLHSTITAEEQSKAFLPPQRGYRKLILATNIAESSITVPDIVYVIDFCLTKSMDMDPRTNFSCLRTVWASLSQCIQRKGRTGRVGKGKVFRLVPREFYGTFDKDTKPEMMRAGLESVIVRVKTFGMGSPKELLSLGIDTPLVSGIERAVVNLKELGGLTIHVKDDKGGRRYDTCDGDLTFLGKLMSELPVPHQCVRLIMLGHVFCVLEECIIIAAGLSIKSPFNTPYRHKLDAYLAKVAMSDKSYSDCIAILHLFREWIAKHDGASRYDAERNWARLNHVQIPGLRDMKRLVEELQSRLERAGVKAVPYPRKNTGNPVGEELSKEQLATIKFVIAGAFYPNYFHRQRPGQGYEHGLRKEINSYDLFNTVYFKKFNGGHCRYLYGGVVAERMAWKSGIPNVTFEGQKVLVRFDYTAPKTGPICSSVYRAVKIRQLRNRMILDVLPKEKESHYFLHHQRILDEQKKYYIPCPSQVNLPPIHCDEVPVVLTHMESPGQFWVVYKFNEPTLNLMSESINRNMEEMIQLDKKQVGPGALCLAPYTNQFGVDTGQYFRARIRTVEREKRQALVYFVDYGNSQWIPTESLCGFNAAHIGANLLTERCLAVECRLGGIKASAMYGSVWHQRTLDNFRIFGETHELKMVVYCVVKSVVVGTLYGRKIIMQEDNPDEIDNNTVNENPWNNVNQRLLDESFAEIVMENSDCRSNHDSRNRYGFMKASNDLDQIRSCNTHQIDSSKTDISYVVPPSLPEANIQMELQGPFSPLELSFVSLCHSSNSKEVTIDDSSVNSVALDQEPAAPTTRLVVASSVSIQDKSGRVVARDTTMMPALPGLMSIMSITFAPKIEMRVNRLQTHYTGVLCGLGMDENTQTPIYQDHDMEIIFHTAIDDDDISKINKLRHYMSLILRGPDVQNVNTELAHQEVVSELIALAQKPREALAEEVWPQDTYSWNKIPKELIVPPREQSIPRLPTDIFQPHATVKLSNVRLSVANWGDYAI